MKTALVIALAALVSTAGSVMQAAQTLPSGPLVIRDFVLEFNPAGSFSLSGAGWPTMTGTYTVAAPTSRCSWPTAPRAAPDPAATHSPSPASR